MTTCARCGQPFVPDIAPDDEATDTRASFSYTRDALCPACMGAFVAWLRQKGYLQMDCWCKHVAEFLGVERA
jgi:hypothetical protein